MLRFLGEGLEIGVKGESGSLVGKEDSNGVVRLTVVGDGCVGGDDGIGGDADVFEGALMLNELDAPIGHGLLIRR